MRQASVISMIYLPASVLLMISVTPPVLLSQVPFEDMFKSLPYVIDGLFALTALLLSIYVASVSLIFGSSPFGWLDFWAGFVLLVVDFGYHYAITGGNVNANEWGGFFRDFIVLLIGFALAFVGISNFFIGLVLLALPIYLWSWQGVVERCCGHCPIVPPPSPAVKCKRFSEDKGKVLDTVQMVGITDSAIANRVGCISDSKRINRAKMEGFN